MDGPAGLRFSDVLYSPIVRGVAQGTYVEELRHFLAVVRGQETPVCSVAEGRAAVAAVLAAEESAASGVEVKIG